MNDRPCHYGICPISDISLDEFIGLLSKLTHTTGIAGMPGRKPGQKEPPENRSYG